MLVAMNGDGPTTGFAVRTIMIGETLGKSGFLVTLLRLYPAFKAQGTWRQQLINSKIRLIEVPIFPTARFPLLRKLSYAIANPLICLLTKINSIGFIQAEAHEAGLAVLRHKPSGVNVIVDFHGAAPEESEQWRRRQETQTHWLDTAEKICLQKADAALVVSPEMIDHLQKKHPLIQKPPFFMVPVNVEENFFQAHSKMQARKKLGLTENHLVYVYSGGAQDYQCIEEMADLFNLLRSKNENARLLIISAQQKEFRQKTRAISPQFFSEVVFISAQKNEVPSLLAAGDIAFLLRKDNILNTVSCPTKFGEYLACGLPVITTAWAGHAPSIVNTRGVGIVVDFNYQATANCIEQFSTQLSTALSQHCTIVARETMHWDISTQNLLDCYQSLTIKNDSSSKAQNHISDEVSL